MPPTHPRFNQLRQSNPDRSATGEVEDKHFWLVEHDGLVLGSGWHRGELGS